MKTETQVLSPEYVNDFVMNAAIALHCVDENGIIVWANKAELDMMGYQPDEYIGHPIAEFHADPERIADILTRLRQNETLNGYITPVRRRDGVIRMVSISSNVYRKEDQFIHTRCFTVDITDHITAAKKSEAKLKETEKALRELNYSLEQKIEERTTELKQKNLELTKSEERYHRMVAEVEDYAILLLDNSGHVQNWNAGAQKIKGYTAQQIIGKHFSVFYFPADREAGLPQQLIEEARTTGKAVHEGWRMRKDGTRFWGSIVITAIHDDQGLVIGFTKVTRDLSQRKENEDRISQYAAQLELQNSELEQFAYSASHDMKEPLRKIQFYMQAVAENTAGVVDEKNRQYLERAVLAASRMNQLLEDILSYARTASAARCVEQVDTTALLTDFILVHQEEIDLHGITIDFSGLPVIRGVPFQLKQLFENLLGNAIKYRHPGRPCFIRVTCNMTLNPASSALQTDSQQQYYRFALQDNGIGFDQQYADKVFEVFQRLHGKAEISGSGVGLAICRKIVQHHKGIIRATGKVNEGTLIEVYLPA